jgi:hypothetical protein
MNLIKKLIIVPDRILTKLHLILHNICQNNGHARIENMIVHAKIMTKKIKMLLLIIAPGSAAVAFNGIFSLLNSNTPILAWSTLLL